MPQFDLLTLSSQIFSLLVSLYLFYYFNITNTILYYTEIKKYRAKKLVKNNFTVQTTQTNLSFNSWLLKDCYKTFL
jgi:hypothetical protein